MNYKQSKIKCEYCLRIEVDIPVDPYAELKAALADGKLVRCSHPDSINDWCMAEAHFEWSHPPECYEIRAKFDPYAELKAAAADPTKQIRYACTDYVEGIWRDYSSRPDMWAWSSPVTCYQIRDKPKPMKKVKLLAWLTSNGEFMLLEEGHAPDLNPWKRVPSEDKEIEVEA